MSNWDEFVNASNYSKYTACTSTRCVFAFSPDGCIFWANLNNPGRINDSPLAADFYARMSRVPRPFHVVSDCGFSAAGAMDGRILKPLRKNQLNKHTKKVRKISLRIHRAIVPLRQAVEWGIASFKASFPRLRLPLPAHIEDRAGLFELCVHLYNYRTRLVDRNQIRTVFNGTWIPRSDFRMQNEFIRRLYFDPERFEGDGVGLGEVPGH